VPGPLLHVGATAQCPHAAPVSIMSSNTRVLVGGMPVATLNDTSLVAGCPLNIAGAPHPCIRVQWLVPATRVLVNAQPALLSTSLGMCLAPDMAPQGTAIVTVTQLRAVAT
jgi:hypothetical protein